MQILFPMLLVFSNVWRVFLSPILRTCVYPTSPLAHMFERIVQVIVFSYGAKVGFFQGDIRLLPDDMRTLKPTLFPTVPRLLNKVYDKVQNEAKTPLKKFLLNLAVASKFREVKRGIIRRQSVGQAHLWKDPGKPGWKVRLLITGAAPSHLPS